MLSELAALTRHRLEELGLSVPSALAEAKVPLWRSSAKAKYHWADARTQCQHVSWGRDWSAAAKEAPPVTDLVEALGFPVDPDALCRGCARQISLSEQADLFVTVAAQIDEAELWANRGRELLGDADTDWLAFARWQAAAPLRGDTWLDDAAALRGQEWGSHAVELRRAIVDVRDVMQGVRQAVCDGISENPARTALIERALRMVENDSAVLAESDRLMSIATGEARTGVHPTAWHITAATWFAAQERGSSVSAAAIAGHLDELFGHVHDLTALECRPDVPYEPGDCVHSWAQRLAAADRRSVVETWVGRLDLALEGLRSAAASTAGVGDHDHFVVVDRWPLTSDGDKLIAYLAQFEPVCGPFAVRDPHGYHDRQVAVLQVPEWAAAHVGDLLEPMRCEPVGNDPYQRIRLARESGISVMPDDFERRDRPSALVRAHREAMTDASARSWQPRPLAPGAQPPGDRDREWSRYVALTALTPGSVFVFGHDDVGLLQMAFPVDESLHRSGYYVSGSVGVEIQGSCARLASAPGFGRHPRGREDCVDGPHICDVPGTVVGTTDDGGLVLVPDGMRDPVPIPPAYLVSLTVTR